jgi:hypothetical protein
MSERKREISRRNNVRFSMPCGPGPERPQAIVVQGIHVRKVIKRGQNDVGFRFGERGMKWGSVVASPGSDILLRARKYDAFDEALTQ